MLPKANRLTSKKDFDQVYKKGKNYKADYLYAKIFFRPVGEEAKARIGFVISRKVESKAVRRNQTKRILRSISRELLKKATGGEILIIVRRTPSENQYQALWQDMEKILTQGGVVR